jgi:putative ABC transport system ATP-binding protein
LKEKTVIKLQGVSKRYQSGESAILAVNDVNLVIHEGDFVLITGPSGSGKTTLLNVIAGLSRVTEGQVIVNEQQLQRLSKNRKAELRSTTLGFIFQFYNLHEGLTAQENVELPMMIANKFPRKERQNRSRDLLNTVGLLERASNMPHELSGGESQRVGIARALANDPPVILADEPTGDLDSKKKREIMDLLVMLNQECNKTLVMVTHDLSMLRIGMRMLQMEDGRIIEDIRVTEEYIEENQARDEFLIGEIETGVI